MRPTTATHARYPRRLLLLAALFAVLASSAASPARPLAPKRAGLDRKLAAIMESSDAKPIDVVIRYVSRPTAADRVALVKAGFVPPFQRFSVVPAVAASGPAGAIRTLARNPRVAYVEHDAKIPYTLDRATQAGRAMQTWSATYQDVDGVHTNGITGRGVGIAIVDTGVDATHPDLLWKPLAGEGRPAKTVANFKMIGRDSAGAAALVDADGFLKDNMSGNDIPHTDNTGGHGTHVAGTAAGLGVASGGKYKGAAPGANIVGFGAGEALSVALGLAAFDYIHLHHDDPALNIRIVSNSWGGPGDWNPDSAVTIAARQLVTDGLVVLFAAGNNGGDGGGIQTSVWANIDDAGIISVANYYDRRGWLDDTSSRGLRSLERTWPDVAASGTEVIATAATAGPVTYFGTGQDAVINHLFEYGEPDVVSVPGAVGTTVEQNVAGQDVVVGPYASFTGTSMATPFVAGVAALVLEANPALTPQQVRVILRETANMVPRRSYETDGFAIGRGVVDAAEAVAVALRVKGGDSLGDALRNAYVDSSGSTYKLNLELPRRVEITSPAAGASVSGTSLTVSGDFIAGNVTDNSIPLLPPLLPDPPAVQGDPHIYQGGIIDVSAGERFVLPGEPVSFSLRALHSNTEDVVMTLANTTAKHVVKKDGVHVAGSPFTAEVRADGENLRSDSDWTVPSDAPEGSYTFEGLVTVGGETYLAGSIPFRVGTPPAPSAPAARMSLPRVGPGSSLGTQTTTLFSEDFEDGSAGWEIENNGTGPGLLTEWSIVDDENALPGTTWAGFNGDNNHKMFWAGTWATAPYASGLHYDDLADTDLISPLIDLSSSVSASLSYWRAGQSEFDFDFLRVYAQPEGATTWTQIDEISGDFVNNGAIGSWHNSTVSLNPFVGGKIRVRFGFTSDETTIVYNLGGWFIDDIEIVGESGTPTTTIVPKLSALPSFGFESLKTRFAFGGESNGTITGYTLDFGDGSDVHTATAAGSVAHEYANPGQYIATLTVAVGAVTQTKTFAIDVAKANQVQVRIGHGQWVDAGAASNANTGWSAALSLAGLSGEQTIYVRHFDAFGNRIVDTITVDVA